MADGLWEGGEGSNSRVRILSACKIPKADVFIDRVGHKVCGGTQSPPRPHTACLKHFPPHLTTTLSGLRSPLLPGCGDVACCLLVPRQQQQRQQQPHTNRLACWQKREVPSATEAGRGEWDHVLWR